jgi:DNA-binding SARP family transcriptional activator/tetratricopeptide (TPR) repeat protein
VRCGILGPLEVVGEHGPVDIGGRKRRALLTYLLLHRQHPVALDQIVDDLWDSAGPSGAGATVQTYISQLRRILDPAKIEKQPAGYVLHLVDDALDAARFEQLSHDVRVSDDAESQLDLADAALALWRAAPLVEFAGAAWADVPGARLTSLRANLVEQRVSALLALGRHAETVAPLETMVAETPLDERFWAQLVVALYRCDRQSDALRALSRVRQILAEELGVQPGARLRELERSVLDQDPALAPPRIPARPAALSPAAPTATVAQADAALASFRPDGVLTFVLTDLVDSTAAWDTQPAAMADAVERHEQLVADAIKGAGGVFLKSRGEGDSTMSVFERASDAVVAARAIVESVAAEPWPVDPPLTVRVAVHTGEALLRNGDYFGGALNRAARLRSLAEGNEVICSRVTAELVAEALPAGTRLVDRGSTELRGLRRPEVLFALVDSEHESRENGGRPAATGPRFAVLGPVVCRDGAIASLPERRLLTRLLVDRNRVVREQDLFEALWDDAPPARARNSLQSKISRLRAIVGGDVIQYVDDGYRVRADADADDCDADQFEMRWEQALAEVDDEAALRLLDQALAAWRGPAFGEFSDAPFARAAAARLETARRSAEDRRLELVARLRPGDEVLWESEKLLSLDPFRESAWVMRLRMLASCGRRVEALRAFHEYRERLADETGLTPSPTLLTIERELLDGVAPTPPANAAVCTPRPTAAPMWSAGGTVVRRGIAWTGPLLPSRELAGRVREMELLDDRLAAARRGDGRVVIISGEAGIGKTRLLDEVVAVAAARGMTVIRGSALGARVAPLGALRGAAATFGIALDDPHPAPDEAIDHDASARRWSSRALALADAIVAQAAAAPTLLAVDDVHAIDDVSMATLELIQGTVADAPSRSLHLVVVATYRSIGTPEAVLARVERFVRTPNGSELRLAGLDEPALVQLVAGAAGLKPTPALVDRLGEAAGNPLVALALLQSLADARALALRDGVLDVVDDVAARVPSDLREVVSALLGGVDASTRGAIARLALLGDGIDLVALRDATGWSDEVTGEILERGESAGVLRVDIDRVVFVHDLVRWTLVQSLPGASRRRMHREMAEALAHTTEPDDAPRVALLADQLRLSGDRRREARVGYWSELAAAQCLARAMWRDAIRHFDAAVDATDTDEARRLELRVGAGIAAFHHHDPARARDRLLPVIESPDARPEVVGEAALVLHRAAFTLTDDAELVARTQDALLAFVDATAGDAALAGMRALALAQLAEAVSGTGESVEGKRLVDAARESDQSLNDDVLSRVEFSTGLVYLTGLDTASARTHFLNSIEHAQRAGDPWLESWGLGRMAFAIALSGDMPAAEEAVSRAVELQHSLRLWSELSLTESIAATLACLRGDYEASISAARDALRYHGRSGYRFAPGLAYPVLAAAYSRQGDWDGAREALQRWRATLPGGQTLFEIAALVTCGDSDRATNLLRRRPLRVVPFSALNVYRLPSVAAAGRVAVELVLTDQLAELLPVVDALTERGVYATLGWPTFLPMLSAEIAAALGDPEADRRRQFAVNAARHLGLS